MVTNITNANFEKEVINSEIPVIIDFWAAWCGPCRMMGPVIDELSNDLAGKVKVCKVDVDVESELSRQFNVMSIPTLIVFENGKIKNTSLGFQSKEKVMQMLK
ncbi:MAG: thioredoxin [Bacillota bacterium]